MNTNHAKAIKGMSIANIVLAALGIFGMLIAWAGLGVGGAAISGSGYDYFYTDDGLYFTTDDVSVLLGMLGFLVFLVIVCAVLILIAGILGVRGAAKPDKLRGIMIWNIVAAVVSLLSCCWVSLVLCIIVAVFANKDRALYAAAPALRAGRCACRTGSPAAARPGRPRRAPAACHPGRRCSRSRRRGRRGRCRRSDARHGRHGPCGRSRRHRAGRRDRARSSRAHGRRCGGDDRRACSRRRDGDRRGGHLRSG